MNPLHNYDQWKAGGYSATVDEWEDWAERIVAAFRAELRAGENDYTKSKAWTDDKEQELFEAQETIADLLMLYSAEQNECAGLHATNAALLEALDAVWNWLNEPFTTVQGWPNEAEAKKAYAISRIVKRAIRKAQG